MYFFTKRFNYFLLWSLAILSVKISSAQNGRKGIYIVNASSKVPVQDATIQSEDLSFNSSSDENGFISFKSLPSTTTRLQITSIGFESKTVELSSLSVSEKFPTIYLVTKVSS